MRVILFVEMLSIGGLPNYVLDLARALTDVGDNVALAHAGDALPSHLELAGITLLSVNAAQLHTSAETLASWAPDLIHVHLCSNHVLLAAMTSLGIPLIRSFHDYTSLCLRRGRRRFPGDRCQRALGRACLAFGCGLGAPNPGSRLPGFKSISMKLLERSSYQQFNASIVGSAYMQGTLVKNGFISTRVHLVPYFSRFDRGAREASGADRRIGERVGVDRPLQLLFTGQAVAGKGLRVLIRALAKVNGKWHLTVVSEGPELPTVRHLTERLNIARFVSFKGWVPQSALRDIYRSADLLVIPSVWDDPGPLVGLEALSLGTPVLGFPVGGIPDYVLDGRTGFLAGSVSAESLAAALRRALERAADLPEMGRAGQKLVAERHSRSEHVKKLRFIYSSALARWHPPQNGKSLVLIEGACLS